jgi:hypothetical protein
MINRLWYSVLVFLGISACAGYVSPVHEARLNFQEGQLEKVAGFLQNSEPEARQEAIILLSKAGECSSRLYSLSRDRDIKVRATLAKSVQHCNDEGSLNILLELLKDISPLVRKNALESITGHNLCNGKCFYEVRKLFEDADSYVRLSAAKMLYIRFPEEAHSVVVDSLSSRLFIVKKEAIDALPLFRRSKDVLFLGEFLQNDDEALRITARKSIEAIVGRQVSKSELDSIIARETKEAIQPVENQKTGTSFNGGSQDMDKLSLLQDMGLQKRAQNDRELVAVIIGNRDYSSVDIPKVDFALRDAQLMKEVAQDVLGVSSENMIYVENGKSSDFNKIFGTSQNPKGLLSNWVNPKSKIFVYYSGHGTPDIKTGDAYFVPVDSDINYIDLSGYPLKQLYKNLETLNVQSITVVIDACFSGVSHAGTITKSASPVFVQVSNPYAASNSKLTVITSSKGDEISTWDNEHGFGLFTYHFVKSLSEVDTSSDGTITIRKIESYVSQKVPYYARRLMNRDQNPQVIGQKDAVLVKYK